MNSVYEIEKSGINGIAAPATGSLMHENHLLIYKINS
jgi:hypothetical protein